MSLYQKMLAKEYYRHKGCSTCRNEIYFNTCRYFCKEYQAAKSEREKENICMKK